MVDAARQMLDELMGRNRNLHPSEAPRKVNWDDAEFCQYHIVKFCPHDLFINTRADLGPCTRIHDDEAKELYAQARQSARKRHYEEEFLRFCCTMLNDVDRKIQKGKQRLQLMNRDQPLSGSQIHVSKYQEQLNNLNGRIKKLLTEAEEAGIRGDVDQAQDLMGLCEQLKEEKEALVAQHEHNTNNKDIVPPQKRAQSPEAAEGQSPKSDAEGGDDKKPPTWVHDLGTLPEKQMEVCEICGAFLIVGDAQQRIEDHLTGKQHLGYSRLRNAVAEIIERREKDHEEEDRKRRDDHRVQRPTNAFNTDRKSFGRDFRDHPNNRNRGRDRNNRHSTDRHRHHHKGHRRRSRSHSNSRSSSSRSHHRGSRDKNSRSRSRSRY